MSGRMRLPISVLFACALAADAAAQSPVVAQQPAPSGTSRVVGRVLSGADALSDAQVTLFLFTNTTGASARWTAATGRDGGFDFQNVPVGRYRLVAERAGYSGMELTATGGMRTGRDFTLADADVAHVDLVLHPAGRISGRITNPDGSPAAGAMVMASVWVGSDPQRRLIGLRAPVAADHDGRYVIADVPPGSFYVRATGDRRQPATPRDSVATLFPGVLESETGDAVVVSAGATTGGVDIRLRRAADQHTLSGRVVDTAGRPVRAVRLTYGDLSEQHAGGIPGVGADGRFSVSDSFTAGSTVSVAARGMTDEGPGVGVGTVQIGGEATEMPPIVLQTPGAIVGRLVMCGPLPEGVVPSMRAHHEHVRLPVVPGGRDDRASIGADGTFRIEGVIGRQQVSVQPLPVGWSVRAVRRRGVPLDDRVIAVQSGEVVDGVEIVVGPAVSTSC